MNQPLQIHFATLDDCHRYEDVVVVIDVCRAFTTAAFAFGSGAERILLTGTTDEALALREQFSGALVMGEVGGMPVPGFDLWNSPAQVQGLDLTGKTLVQRTSAGTQGVVRATAAAHLLASSFAVAGATVEAIRRRNPSSVAFVITGVRPENPHYGREDAACAEYMADLLQGKPTQPNLSWVDSFTADRLPGAPEEVHKQFAHDVELCKQVDTFPFALRVERRDGLLVMEREQ